MGTLRGECLTSGLQSKFAYDFKGLSKFVTVLGVN